MKYADIIFLQGSECEEAFAACKAEGSDDFQGYADEEERLLDYLSSWDYRDNDNIIDTLGHGSRDTTLEKGEYILSYNDYLSYCGLVRKIKE